MLETSSLERPGPLSFRSDHWESVGEWKGAARARLRQLLASPQTGPLPGVRILRGFRVDGLEGEDLEWQLPYGPPTRALFLKPAGARGPLPAVMGLHDHGGVKYFGLEKITRTDSPQHELMRDHQAGYYGGRAWANTVAARGFAVLVHDGFLFGSRRVMPSELQPHVVERMMAPPLAVPTTADAADAGARAPAVGDVSPRREPAEIRAYNAFAARHEDIVAKALFSAGLTWPGVFLADDRAALDVLCSRPEVDPHRVGCCGLSGGGLRTNLLAAMDERVRCSVTVGFMTTWSDFVLNVCHTHTWMVYIPHLPGLLDYPEILSLHRRPRPSCCRRDRTRSSRRSRRGARRRSSPPPGQRQARAMPLPCRSTTGLTSSTCRCRRRRSPGSSGG
jgi:dienelactone hydrolase